MILCFLHFPPGESIQNIVQTFIRDHCPVLSRDLMIKQCHKSENTCVYSGRGAMTLLSCAATSSLLTLVACSL